MTAALEGLGQSGYGVGWRQLAVSDIRARSSFPAWRSQVACSFECAPQQLELPAAPSLVHGIHH